MQLCTGTFWDRTLQQLHVLQKQGSLGEDSPGAPDTAHSKQLAQVYQVGPTSQLRSTSECLGIQGSACQVAALAVGDRVFQDMRVGPCNLERPTLCIARSWPRFVRCSTCLCCAWCDKCVAMVYPGVQVRCSSAQCMM